MEPLNKSKNSLSRHYWHPPGINSCQYPLPPFRGKVGWGYIVYWMLAATDFLGNCSRRYSRSPLPARLYRLLPCNRTTYLHVVVSLALAPRSLFENLFLTFSRSLFQTRLYRFLPWNRTAYILVGVPTRFYLLLTAPAHPAPAVLVLPCTFPWSRASLYRLYPYRRLAAFPTSTICSRHCLPPTSL